MHKTFLEKQEKINISGCNMSFYTTYIVTGYVPCFPPGKDSAYNTSLVLSNTPASGWALAEPALAHCTPIILFLTSVPFLVSFVLFTQESIIQTLRLRPSSSRKPSWQFRSLPSLLLS